MSIMVRLEIFIQMNDINIYIYFPLKNLYIHVPHSKFEVHIKVKQCVGFFEQITIYFF